MLSLFPQLLFLTPAAIALLRVVTGAYVLYVAWHISERRSALSHEKYPIIGKAPEWLIVPAAFLYAIVGGLLVVGAWTQIAALGAALGMLKLSILSRSHPSLTVLPVSTYLVLLAVSLALVCTGAGAFAFDLPL